ncbi:VOC family protein [Martelella alba]|uniref:VOC family protein n=1 Tax=Martelella alba TaxID=2590451 RepID=A0A506UIK4_9HYPH|nr:VOC family protein [Martelella alba]TPW33128.1 VOC family protein [Martelella alba]
MDGQFIWYELLTSDVAAAGDFYSRVTGWQRRDSGVAGTDYALFAVEGFEMAVGGLMALTPEMIGRKVPPNWSGYVDVADVDGKAAEFEKAGGQILVSPQDIPKTGRFAVLADPFGAVINLFCPAPMDGPMPEGPKPPSPGTFAWHELYTSNPDAAMAFYADMFGWQADEPFDMGEMGQYLLFSAGGRQIGGMMRKLPDMPMSFWNYYAVVDAIDAAAARVRDNGGRIINGPHQVPGGSFILQCIDPQGAMFSLTASKR